MGRQVVFAHEASERLHLACLGTSGHAFRNYLPVFPFLPVELVAQWDPDLQRARAFAAQFGAGDAAYDDVDRLLQERRPQAVLIATDATHPDGRSIQPDLVTRCLEAGCHVFCDKPIASTADEVRALIDARNRTGKVVGVGIKTMHYPTHTRAHEIIHDASAGFGELLSLTVRYPLHVPARAGLPLTDGAVKGCLGHVWHPIGTALRLGGPLRSVRLLMDRSGRNGVLSATFRGGAVGAFHFPRTKSGMSPLEHVEAVGEGAEIVVENAAQLTYYRKASPGPYGRTIDAFTPLESGPLTWRPELSLGQLYNNHNFIQGYGQSLLHFVDAVTGGHAVTVGTLEDALEVMKVHEALRQGPGPELELGE